MTNVDTISTYFASHSVGGGNMVTTGALDSGSITSGFGTIDTGSSNITTTGTVSAGNLTVSGTTTTVNSTVMTVVDPIIHLQTASGGGALGTDTNKDVGLALQYHTGSAAKTAFLGFDDSAGKLTFIPDASLSSEVVSGTAGTIVANLEGVVTGDVTGNADTATAFAEPDPDYDPVDLGTDDGSGNVTGAPDFTGIDNFFSSLFEVYNQYDVDIVNNSYGYSGNIIDYTEAQVRNAFPKTIAEMSQIGTPDSQKTIWNWKYGSWSY